MGEPRVCRQRGRQPVVLQALRHVGAPPRDELQGVPRQARAWLLRPPAHSSSAGCEDARLLALVPQAREGLARCPAPT
eukprot:15441730-Alexandrium_andersonii.AAC.1